MRWRAVAGVLVRYAFAVGLPIAGWALGGGSGAIAGVSGYAFLLVLLLYMLDFSAYDHIRLRAPGMDIEATRTMRTPPHRGRKRPLPERLEAWLGRYPNTVGLVATVVLPVMVAIVTTIVTIAVSK